MHERRRGILFIACAALLWSSGGIGIKAVADSALKVTFYRSLFAAVALMLFLGRGVWGRRRWASTPAFLIAVLSYAACLTTFVVATKWTTAGEVATAPTKASATSSAIRSCWICVRRS